MKVIFYWLPVLICAGVIYAISSIPSLDAPALFPHFDKVFHVGEYFFFGALLTRAVYHTWNHLTFGQLIAIVSIGSLLYGISDEYHQSFVEGRSASALDLLADVVGGYLGVIIYSKVILKK